MRVRCRVCKKIYDDYLYWSTCPHNSLDVPVDATYCTKHDMYNCVFCPADRQDYNQHSDCSSCGKEGVWVNEDGVCKDCIGKEKIN